MAEEKAPELEIDPSTQGTRTPAFEDAMARNETAPPPLVAPTPVESEVSLKGKTGKELEKSTIQKQAEQADKKGLTASQTIDPAEQTVRSDELMDKGDKLLQERKVDAPTKIDTDKFKTDPTIPKPAEKIDVREVKDVGKVDVKKGEVSDKAVIVPAIGTPSPESLAVAAKQELDPRATTQYQLKELFSGIEDGSPPPAWAAPAVRKVTAIMQQRGLGSSSIAAAATMQAMIESGIPIAAQDANKYATIQLQNLNNEQQAAMQNATVLAAMDTANLNNRQVAAVNNAKSFLSMDVANLTNEQQANTLTFQSKVQTLLSDQAAVNASKQFNAKSENETNQFFSELAYQIDSASKNRMATLEQYNISQEQATRQFNSQMLSARDQFNANMSMQIDQSNAVWRRSINTQNTAAQNEANRQNALNLLSLNQNSMNNLWQLYRDNASWAMKISENAKDRAHNAAMQSEAIAGNSNLYDDKFEDYLLLEIVDTLFGG